MTASIRPCSGIIGANDNINLQPILKTGNIDVMVPWARSDTVYVDNVVWGHLLLEKKMQEEEAVGTLGRASVVAGQVFAITNREPVSFLEYYLKVKHYKPDVKFSFAPYYFLTLFAPFNELLNRMGVMTPPPLNLVTPPMLDVCRACYAYSDEKAGRVLGYSPMFTMDEGIMASIVEAKKWKTDGNA